MMRPFLVVFAILAPIAASAQVTTAADDQRVSASAPQNQAATLQPSLQSPARAPAPDRRPRRRGSMVGYIEDPVVSSKVRIRFDAGLHTDAPDRAEFFYAKCGCYRDLPSSAPEFDPAAPGPGPGAASELNFQQLYVLGEYAVSERFSVFGEMPVRWIQPQEFLPGTGGPFPNHGGLSDLRAGARFALVDSERALVTVQVRGFMPTGKALNGLGTDHGSIEPALLMYHQLTDRFSIESQIGDWHPFGGSAGVPTSGGDKFSGDVLFYGIGPSYELYSRENVSFVPIVELVGWHVLDGFQTASPADAGGTNIVNLKIGARTTWRGQNSFYVGFGHALTDASWYDSIWRFEFRRSF